MTKGKVTHDKLSSLIPDDLNANRHSEYGMQLLEKSIAELGLGRSIVVDKNGRVIAGNAVVETAANLGLENIIVVPTDGNSLVVVKREDVDIDSKKGRELALADNSVARINLAWDNEVIANIQKEWNVQPEDWGIDTEFTPHAGTSDSAGSQESESTCLIVESDDPDRLNDLFFELKDRGFMVQLKELKDHD